MIFERVGHTVYVRDPKHPDRPRRPISDDKTQNKNNISMQELVELSNNNEVFKKQLDKLIDLYYILKEDTHNGK